MTDDKPVTGEQTDATSGAAGAPQQAQAGSGETLESLRAELEKERAAKKAANQESASRRKRLEELEAAEAQRTEASKTETQKLSEKATKAEQERDAAIARAQDLALRNAVTVQASKMQFTDPGDALAFIDKSKLKVNEDGSVEGLDAELERLSKSKPYLLARSAASQLTATMPGHSGAQGGETREQRRARIQGGGSANALSGGYVPIKE